MVVTIIVTTCTPNQSMPQLNKLWLKLRDRKLPASMKRIETYAVPTLKGVRGFTIYEVEDSKVAEAIREIAQRQAIYQETEGYRWKAEIALKAAEAVALYSSGSQR